MEKFIIIEQEVIKNAPIIDVIPIKKSLKEIKYNWNEGRM